MRTKCLSVGAVALFILGMLPGSAHANIDPKTVVGIWFFDDGGGGVAKDSSGNGNDGTLNGPTWTSKGTFDGALEFDGAGSYIEFATGESMKTPHFTIMAWFNTRKVTGYGHIFQTGNDWNDMAGYVFRVHQDGTVQAGLAFGPGNATTFVTGPAIQANTWYHMALTFDGTTATLYLDGVNVASGAGQGKIMYDNQPVRIGSLSNAVGSAFDGFIDEVALFNMALEADDIQTIMDRGLAEIAGDPVVAFDPLPANGQTDVHRDSVLSWTAGVFADTHNVYFGTSFNDVSGASTLDPRGALVREGLIGSSFDVGRLTFGQTYYWRVDEVNAPPDSTVFKGDIWSFTTELYSYPIAGANITTTASSMGATTFGPENTINGSGLNQNDLHSTVATDMWLSGNELAGAWIQYEFDKAYKLHEMWVWNSNQAFEGLFGFGLKDVTIEYSTNGTDWTALIGVPQFAKAPGTAGYAHNTTVGFGGVAAKFVKLTAASNWGGLLPQYSLSEVRFFYVPVMAREPSPDRGATGVGVDGALSWRAGREAAAHRVYLSTDRQAVIDGTAPAVNVAGTSYSSPLDLAGTYYWRIDEVNEAETPTTWQGDVWDFTTEEFTIVEDFEDYNDYPPYEIYTTWLDGYTDPANGSEVGNLTPPLAETRIIHGGAQSMPLTYTNTGGATYSEAKRTFAAPQDWTKHGIKTLTLWFQGSAGNTGTLYVKINNSKITYAGGAGDIALTGWQPWNINLAASGANVQSVNSLAIGIDGNGAAGKLYLDDIRLYPYEPQLITPVAPNAALLIGDWTFDGNTQDSSTKANHGTSGVTPAAFVAGKVGSNAMNFRGADYVVIDGVVNDITSTDITLSAWIKTTQSGEGEIFAANDAASDHPVMLAISGGSPSVNDGSDHTFPPAINDDQWHLLTYVRSGDTGYVYVDGLLRGTYASSFSLASVTRWSIGQEWDNAAASNFYTGAVDDARLYNTALSEAEVAGLSGRTRPFDKPF